MGAGIVIEIGADVKKAISGITKVNKAIGSQMTTAQKFKAGIDRAFVPALAVVGAVGVAATLAAKKASDLAETQSKVAQIFGESSKELQAWSLAAPTALGQTQNAALDAAATMATFGKAAGLTGSELVNFSKETVNLSGDLASFYNTDPAEVVSALGSALRGESEPMRKFGVLLNNQTLEAEAMVLGIWDGTGALTAQQKVLAAQAAIMKQTTDAQGDFARTADGAANQQRIFTAQMEQFQTEMGSVLLPVLTAVTGIMASMAGWMRENSTLAVVLIGVVTGLAAAIIAMKVAMVVYSAASTIATAATWLFNAALLANPLAWVVIAIVAVIAVVVAMYLKFDWFRKFIDDTWDAIQKAMEPVIAWWSDTAWPIVKKVIDFIVAYYTMLLKIMIFVWGGIFKAIGAVVSWFMEYAWPVIRRIVDFIVAYYKMLFEVMKFVWSGIFNAIKAVVSWFMETAWPIIQRVVDFIVNYYKMLLNAVVTVWNGIRSAISGPVKWLQNTVVPMIRSAIDAVTRIFTTLKNAIFNVFESIKNIVSNAWDFVIGKLNAIRNAISGIPGLSFVAGDTRSLAPVIPFSARSSAILGTQARTGSRSTSASGGATITINGALDPVAVARQIRKLLRDENTRMGSVA